MMKLKAKQILGLDTLNYIPKTGNTSTTIANSIYATTISGGTLYGDGSNLTGIGAGSDTYVTGFTYSDNNLTIQQNLNKSPLTVNISTMTGLTINGTLSATTLYGDGSNLTGLITNDFYVTGGTFSGTTLTLDRQNGSVVITGFTSSGGVDTYVTGFTYSNNNITLTQNQNQTPLSVNISTMTGLTVNGTISATTYQGDGSQLSGVQSTNASSKLFNYYNFI